MKTLFAILIWLVLLTQATSLATIIIRGPVVANAGSPPVTFSDDFNRSSSTNLGANWTEDNNDFQIVLDTKLENVTASSWCLATHNTTTNTVFQYGKLTIASNADTVGTGGAGFLAFRYVNSSSPFYIIGVNSFNGDVEWYSVPDATFGSTALIQGSALGFSSGDTFGVVVSGTGNGTEVRIWKNPTGNAPDTGGTTWGGAGPSVSAFTNNPGTACDTGTKTGIAFTGSAGGWLLDDFYAGDVTP